MQIITINDVNIIESEEATLIETQAVTAPSPISVQVVGDHCPYCEQPIPNDKARAIRARVEAEDRDRLAKLTDQVTQKFLVERETVVAAARDEARIAAEQTLAHKLLETEQATADAFSKYEALKAEHDRLVEERVQEVRETLEKDMEVQVSANNAKHFDETQKLSTMVNDLQRKLEKKTNEELGEGAEIDLFEALKAEFSDDRIERIGKGKPGADIRHVVIHNGRECGKLIYDSKNRGAWRNEHVTKLVQDQRSEKADHAILVSLKFPASTRQLHIEDGVIIANPARVVTVVQMLRQYMVQISTLRLSNTDRAEKTAALYDLITSKRFGDHLSAIDGYTEDLLALQDRERRAHEVTWKQQGTLIRTIQKVRAGISAEIDAILESD